MILLGYHHPPSKISDPVNCTAINCCNWCNAMQCKKNHEIVGLLWGDIGAAKTEQWLTTQAYIECDTGGNNSNLLSSLHNEGIEKSGKLAIVCLENMVALKYALS